MSKVALYSCPQAGLFLGHKQADRRESNQCRHVQFERFLEERACISEAAWWNQNPELQKWMNWVEKVSNRAVAEGNQRLRRLVDEFLTQVIELRLYTYAFQVCDGKVYGPSGVADFLRVTPPAVYARLEWLGVTQELRELLRRKDVSFEHLILQIGRFQQPLKDLEKESD